MTHDKMARKFRTPFLQRQRQPFQKPRISCAVGGRRERSRERSAALTRNYGRRLLSASSAISNPLHDVGFATLFAIAAEL
jgi:hypothetical protein